MGNARKQEALLSGKFFGYAICSYRSTCSRRCKSLIKLSQLRGKRTIVDDGRILSLTSKILNGSVFAVRKCSFTASIPRHKFPFARLHEIANGIVSTLANVVVLSDCRDLNPDKTPFAASIHCCSHVDGTKDLHLRQISKTLSAL